MNEVQPTDGISTTTVATDDGRTYTGVNVDADQVAETLKETSFGTPKTGAVVEDAPKPKESKGRQRFFKLDEAAKTAARERDEAKAKAEANEAELRKLKAELEARAKPTEPVAEPPKKETVAEKKERLRLEHFAAHPDTIVEDYVEAAIQKGIEEALEKRLGEHFAQEKATTVLHDAIADSGERGREAYPDFKSKLDSLTIPFSGVILEAIARAPGSEHIQYALASDPALAQQVAGLANDHGQITDPVALGMMLGRLGSVTERAERPASRPAAVGSKAPAPVQPVVGGSRTASKTLDEIAAAGDVEAYKRLRHSQMGVSAR